MLGGGEGEKEGGANSFPNPLSPPITALKRLLHKQFAKQLFVILTHKFITL